MAKLVVTQRKHERLPIGDLNSRVIVQRSLTIPGQGGKSGKQFIDMFPRWMKIETLPPRQGGLREFDKTNTEEAPTHRFTCRFRSDITAERFLWYKGRRYTIVSTENVGERNEYLRILARFTGVDEREASEA